MSSAPSPTPQPSDSTTPTAAARKPRGFIGFIKNTPLRSKLLVSAVVLLVALGVVHKLRAKKPSQSQPPAPAVASEPTHGGAPSQKEKAQGTAAAESDRHGRETGMPDSVSTARRGPKSESMEGGDVPVKAPNGLRDTGEVVVTKALTSLRDDALTPVPSGQLDDGRRASGRPMSEMRNAKKSLPEIFGMPDAEQPAAATNQPNTAQVQVTTPTKAPADTLAEEFAPFGRLVRCHLVNTVDSLTPTNVPLIAMTDDDLYWNGKLIIPANTEVFAYVASQAQVDVRGVGRLYDQGEWTLVLPAQGDRVNGREWRVKGRALDRSETVVDDMGGVRSWSINDMAPGLIGATINTLDSEEVKLFVAAFFGQAASGAKEALQSRESIPGQAGANGYTQVIPNLKNAVISAVGSGTASVFERAVARIEDEIKKRGFYVRVPSGHQFYLFVEQTLDPRTQRVGVRAADAEGSSADAISNQGANSAAQTLINNLNQKSK